MSQSDKSWPLKFLTQINILLIISINSTLFFFTPITEDEIEREIIATPNNKSCGLYSFPVTILKCAKHLLKKTLAEIFNISVIQGKYPSKLKISRILFLKQTMKKIQIVTDIFHFYQILIVFLKN